MFAYLAQCKPCKECKYTRLKQSCLKACVLGRSSSTQFTVSGMASPPQMFDVTFSSRAPLSIGMRMDFAVAAPHLLRRTQDGVDFGSWSAKAPDRPRASGPDGIIGHCSLYRPFRLASLTSLAGKIACPRGVRPVSDITEVFISAAGRENSSGLE